MKIKLYLISLLVALFVVAPAAALTPRRPTDIPVQEILSYFRSVQDIKATNFPVVTVVQLSVIDVNATNYVVYENETKTIQPHAIVTIEELTPFLITSNNSTSDRQNLHDNDTNTFVDYNFDTLVEGNNLARFEFSYKKPIITSSLQYSLAANVQEPKYVTIQITEPGKINPTILVNRQRVYGGIIQFPRTFAQQFSLTFEYDQFLRISELGFKQLETDAIGGQYLRFLARPGLTYKLYSHPTGNVPYIKTAEVGDLTSNNVKAVTISTAALYDNPLFIVPDSDADGVLNSIDNCAMIQNSDQKDINNNGRGDACEDFDGDGIMNAQDNCPDNPNKVQQDADSDRIGDHCDTEESRLIERLSFLPWVGLVVGFGVVIFLFRSTLKKTDNETPEIKNTESKM